MRERELPVRLDQQPGESYCVAAALASVHGDNDLLKHPHVPSADLSPRLMGVIDCLITMLGGASCAATTRRDHASGIAAARRRVSNGVAWGRAMAGPGRLSALVDLDDR